VHRRAVGLGAVLTAAACIKTTEPTNFVFRYAIVAVGCDTTCATPGDTAITTAARGDTIWVSHVIELLGAIDSVTPQQARLRPDCAENVSIIAAGNAVRSLPTAASCPDSTYQMSFTLGGVTYPSDVSVFTRWIIDSALTPGTYGIRGRVLVTPRLEPTFGLQVQ
jgi:hypothetical protein